MVFEASKFLQTPDLDEFEKLKKEDLVLLAKHLQIDFKVSMRKQTIKNLIIDNLVDDETFGEEALELKVESVDALKLKQLDLEHEFKLKLEMQEKQKQLELGMQEKQAELVMKQKQAELEMQEKQKRAELEMEEKQKRAEIEMQERLEMEKLKLEHVKFKE